MYCRVQASRCQCTVFVIILIHIFIYKPADASTQCLSLQHLFSYIYLYTGQQTPAQCSSLWHFFSYILSIYSLASRLNHIATARCTTVQASCYISLYSTMTTSPTPLTPPTSTPTYIFHFNLHFLFFKSIPWFPLLPLLHSYHSYHLSLYFLITAPCLTFFPVLWLSLINLPLPYCTILQTKPPHLSILCYINCSYFVVVLQFVNCSQLLTI